MKMKTLAFRQTQRGGFLLEALIGVLIFSFGILGIVGLQAQSLRHTGDAEYRAEATYLANSLISKMWTDDPAVLQSKYDSTVGTGAGYVAFTNDVANLPGVVVATSTNLPAVLVDPAAPAPQPPSLQAHVVQVTVFWQLPGDPTVHNYTTTGVVGKN
ncbi:MAG TPA: pilus assembly protein PilV [Casimicrobiaceae bacterium]